MQKFRERIHAKVSFLRSGKPRPGTTTPSGIASSLQHLLSILTTGLKTFLKTFLERLDYFLRSTFEPWLHHTKNSFHHVCNNYCDTHPNFRKWRDLGRGFLDKMQKSWNFFLRILPCADDWLMNPHELETFLEKRWTSCRRNRRSSLKRVLVLPLQCFKILFRIPIFLLFIPDHLSRLRSKFLRQSLAGRILLFHIIWGGLVYILAVGGLWWSSTRVMENNFQDQTRQWVKKLDEIGTLLYTSDNPEVFQTIRDQVEDFPEIAFVRFYDSSGQNILSQYTNPRFAQYDFSLMSADTKKELDERGNKEQRVIMDKSPNIGNMIRARTPLLVKSIPSDGLLDFNVNSPSRETVRILGYMGLGLDYSPYYRQLARNIFIGSLFILLIFLILALAGRYAIKRALRPLSDLQVPLAKLAEGETDVRVKPSGDKEIRVISQALNSTISALKERDERLRRLAEHDPLTGLVNRQYISRELDSLLENYPPDGMDNALFFLDLDQFKIVNDTVGHSAGDRLLVQVGQLLKARMREDDVIARFGGDEFVILVRHVSRESAESIASSLLHMMRDFVFVEGGQSFSIYFSIGIAMIENDRFTSEELFSQADSACLTAKSQGRNQYSFYQLSEVDENRLALDIGWSKKIKSALDDDNFFFHFQPVLSLTDSKREIYEVLLRMRSKDPRMIAPNTFLPIARRFGLDLEIDKWVIHHALHKLAKARSTGRDIVFSINLSGHIFESPGLTEQIQKDLATLSLPPSCLIFEISEQSAVRYMETVYMRIRDLIKMGCMFALDDFGVGFSSFSYLKHLPVHYIKIVGNLVENMSRDPIDRSMVDSMVKLSKSIGKMTVAKYVQDAKTLEMLTEMGVDYVQGYFTGEPSENILKER